MFRGVYSGRQVHAPDLGAVLSRAAAAGVCQILVTAGSVAEIDEARRLCDTHDPLPALDSKHSTECSANRPPIRLATTVGVHPTRCNELAAQPETQMAVLRSALTADRRASRVAALGELGLDYDRTHFCPPDVQRTWFAAQLALFAEVAPDLPLFLHMRGDAAVADFFAILAPVRPRFAKGGVVHSYTGSVSDALRVVNELGLAVGINGCSVRTQTGLEVVAALPLESIVVESDAPWCDIRATSPAHGLVVTVLKAVARERYDPLEQPQATVKGRSEPLASRQVLEVIASVKNLPLDVVASAVHRTSEAIFGDLSFISDL